MSGLTWLAADADSWPFCFTFVRGSDERAVFEAFGADPRDAIPVPPNEFVSAPPGPSMVRVGRAGDWIFALEEDVRQPQGTRPEVLRRVSRGTEAVAIFSEIAKSNHEFAHARDGELIAAVTTDLPLEWSGSDPARLIPLAEELGLRDEADADLDDLEVLLALAEGVFGISLDEADLDRPWPAAPVLPVLDDLPGLRPGVPAPRSGDPVLDLLMARIPDDGLSRILAIRVERVSPGLGDTPELAAAISAALAGGQRGVTDDDPAGIALRRAALHQPDIVRMLRYVLAGRRRDALISDAVLHKRAGTPGWREQFIADLGDLDVPADEMRAAEAAARAKAAATPGIADPGPVRSHVRALLDAGMEPTAIMRLGRMTPIGFERLMNGTLAQVRGVTAQRILAIEVPPRGEA
jgi:hypothetical protein